MTRLLPNATLSLQQNLSPLFILYSLSFSKIYFLEFTFPFSDLKDKEFHQISLVNEHLALLLNIEIPVIYFCTTNTARKI